MGTFSYRTRYFYQLSPEPRMDSKIFVIGGDFSNAQAAGSTIPLGPDEGVDSILWADAKDITQTSIVKIVWSAAKLTLKPIANDHHGYWECKANRM